MEDRMDGKNISITPATAEQYSPPLVDIDVHGYPLGELGQMTRRSVQTIEKAALKHATSLGQGKPASIAVYCGHLNSDNVTHINLKGIVAPGGGHDGRFSVKIRPYGQSKDDPYFFHLKSVASASDLKSRNVALAIASLVLSLMLINLGYKAAGL